MKYLSLLLLFITHITIADPFYNEDHTRSSDSKPNKAEDHLTSKCELPDTDNQLNLESTFSKLKFIGVVKKKDEIKALLLDEKDRLLELHENDFIANQLVQIKAISLNKLAYLDWTSIDNCNNPVLFYLML